MNVITTHRFDRRHGRCYPETIDFPTPPSPKDSLWSRRHRYEVPPLPLSQRAILPQAYRKSPSTPPGSSRSSDSGSSTYVNFHNDKRHTPPSPLPSTSRPAASSQGSHIRSSSPTATIHIPHKPRSDPGLFSPPSRWSPDSLDEEHKRGRRDSAGVMRRLSDAASGLARRLSSGSRKASSKRSSTGTKSSKSSDSGGSLSHSLRRHYQHYYHRDGSGRNGLQRHIVVHVFDSTTAVADLNLEDTEYCDDGAGDAVGGGVGDSRYHRKAPSSSFFDSLPGRLVARMSSGHERRGRKQDKTPPLSRSSRYAENFSRHISPREP
ncbi:translocation protein SEC63 [Apiospora arundinis]